MSQIAQRGRGTRTINRQLLGLAVLLLTVVPGYLASRISANEVASSPSAPAIAADVEATFDEVVENTPTGTEIDQHIREIAARHRVSEELIVAIIEAESRFDAHAVSRRGAVGLMQLMPATAATLGVSDPFDPRENIDAGVRHLRAMMAHFPGDLPLALAAYNAGEKAVIRHRGMPPYRETREYVNRILRRFHGNRPKTQYHAAYALTPLRRLVAGETVSVKLRVTNTGTAAWNNAGPCAAVLGDHWYQGRTRLVSETEVAPLPAPVNPGQTVELGASISVPDRPGTYTLAWDMRAQCEWFTKPGDVLRSQRVEVVYKR
jgi:Transglycosylase SLT domain/Ig-like domain from next to BRCA1 gene